MASPQADAIKELYDGWLQTMGARPDMGLDEMRDMFEHWGDITGEPGEVDYVEVDAGGVPAMWAIPKDCTENRVALCTHGGGYVCGSMYTHRKMFGHIAKAIGCRALILHYRRAPEHTHPAQVDDAVTAYKWLLDQGIEAGHVCTTGDSAGGALSTTVLLGIREAGLPLPAAAMPMSPWYDPEGTGASLVSNAEKDCLVKAEVLKGMAATFLGNASPKDPKANPLQADLDIDGRQAGVEVRLDIFPDMQHVFQFMAGRAPEADDAVRRMAEWVKPRLGL